MKDYYQMTDREKWDYIQGMKQFISDEEPELSREIILNKSDGFELKPVTHEHRLWDSSQAHRESVLKRYCVSSLEIKECSVKSVDNKLRRKGIAQNERKEILSKLSKTNSYNGMEIIPK